MSAIQGDFIGFTYGGVHSKDLGIVRVSNGSRYTETLLPEFSNKTMNVPGANRTDYLGMEYTQKSFPLDIAFDSVTEVQLRQMKKLFSTQVPLPLIFDETPYKTYYAKAGNSPSINYICFDEDGKRIYKGEGKIDLVSYFPYGFCDRYFLADKSNYVDNIFKYGDINEWNESAGLYNNAVSNPYQRFKDNYGLGGKYYDEATWNAYNIIGNVSGQIDNQITNFNNKYTTNSQNTGLLPTQVYNPGDFDVPFVYTVSIADFNRIAADDRSEDPNETIIQGGKIFLRERYENQDGTYTDKFFSDQELEWNTFATKDGETYLIFNGYNQLIEGAKLVNGKLEKSGNIYNKHISRGGWFDIPKNIGSVDSSDEWYINIRPSNWSGSPTGITSELMTVGNITLDYKILYI